VNVVWGEKQTWKSWLPEVTLLK